MIIEIGITGFMVIAVFLMSLLAGDILDFVMFITMSAVATGVQMVLVEMDGGQIFMSHMSNYIMWGVTISFIVILAKRLKGIR